MSKLAAIDYNEYLRTDRMPTTWCSGCGDGIIMKSIIRAIDAVDFDRDNVAVVSGIGCSGRMSGYLDFNTLHTTHGRAIAYATGIKLAEPKSKVIVVTGDGDCLAIGGNHFIHAARRNIDLTVLIVNNLTYGLTGGQISPESPDGTISPTAPFGNIEPLFNTAPLAIGAGASYVARTIVSSPVQMDKMIKGAIQHEGFSVVEIFSNCHINWGRKNETADPHDLIKWMTKNLTTFSADEADKTGKHLMGVIHHDKERLEYTHKYYNEVIPRALEKTAKKMAH